MKIEIPFYEIYYYNIQKPSLIDLITYKLYKYNYYHIFDKIIYILDKFKFRKYNKNNKIIEELYAHNNLYLQSYNNYNKVIKLYRTKPFIIYKLYLENNTYISIADTHIVYTNKGWDYIKNLNKSSYVYTKDGYIKVKKIVKTNNKQFLCDISIDSQTHDYYTNNILSHNTTTCCAYFSWYCIFHNDKNIMITANKESTTKEILRKTMEVFKGLPYFLKPGIEEYSKTTLRLENGSSIRAVATTGDSATGDSINILLIDECALIPQNVMKEFWASVYPTLSSFRDSQIIVLSTPRGRSGLFYDIWDGAQSHKNGFISKRVDWWQVPGHDEKWKEDQIAVFGQDLWEREFELSFDTNESRLLSPDDFKFLESIKEKFINVYIHAIPKKVCDRIYWKPNFNPDELTYDDKIRRRFICIIDTAEGTEKGEYGKEDADYNIIDIFEIKLLDPDIIQKNRLGYKAVKYTNCIYLEQVGIYIDNNFDEEECAAAAQHIAFDIFSNGSGYEGEIDNMRILFEKNFNGKNFKNIFAKHDMYYEAILNSFLTTGGNHGKKYYCELGAKLIGLRQIIVSQDHDIPVMSTIEQLKTFGKVKNSYAGLSTHDDIAITVLFASRFFDDEKYFEWLDEWFTLLPQLQYEDKNEYDKLHTILHYLDIYEYVKDDELDNTNDEIYSYAAQGLGQITNKIEGTYGSLMNIDNQQTINSLQQRQYQSQIYKHFQRN